MSAQKVNYEELKPYIPQNGNEENYALLTHYLMMHNTEQKELKRAELINSFEFSEEKLLQAENFFHNKNIPFTVQAEPSFAFIDLFAGIGGFRLGVPLTSFGSVFLGFRFRSIRGQAANGYAAPTIPNAENAIRFVRN